MKKINGITILFFVACTKLFSQTEEKLVPLTENPIQVKEFQQRLHQQHSTQRTAQAFPTDTIELPASGLFDDFSYDSHRPDTTLWDYDTLMYSESNRLGSGVFINRTWAYAPINLGVCTFDGLNCMGEPYDTAALTTSTGPSDELVSRPIDLSAYSVSDSVYLSFWYEPEGRGYAPNAMDSLVLEFNSPTWNIHLDTITHRDTVSWRAVWFKEGYTPLQYDTNFHLVMIKLDSASYFVKGFRFRFHNWATQCGSNDHWHIDDVYLKSNRSRNDTVPGDVAFAYPPNSALKDFWSMPYKDYKPSMMATNYNVQMRNNDTALVDATYWYYAYDETHTQISVYPNAGGAVYHNFPTYWTSGYGNNAPITNPPINFSFPQGTVNADTGTFEVKHVLKYGTQIDSCYAEQKFMNYYAYDDGTAEVGYGLLYNNSLLAYKFTLPPGATDTTLKAVEIYFLPVINFPTIDQETWTLTVWGDQAGQPGTVIYTQRTEKNHYRFETPDRFYSYGIDSGTVRLTGTFYVGWQQDGADNLYVGMDLNDNHQDKIYHNSTGVWYTSIYPGSLMIRPVFGTVYPPSADASGIQEYNSSAQFSIYPNPANDQVKISGLKDDQKNDKVSVMDISGREVIPSEKINEDGSLDVSSLSSGIYLVQVKKENGEILGTQKLVIGK